LDSLWLRLNWPVDGCYCSQCEKRKPFMNWICLIYQVLLRRQQISRSNITNQSFPTGFQNIISLLGTVD
jgi:hypothetical protein